MQVSIIIVNYNVKFFLEQCLFSLRKAIASLEAEVIVVDNASADGSMEYLLSRFPEVNFIDNPENNGFSKACNQGLEIATGKFILFLNPDTILSEDSISKCVLFLDSHTEAGACGVRMVDGTGRFLPESKRAFPSLSTSFYKLSGLSAMFPRSPRFSRYYLPNISERQNKEVDVLSGAFMMVRKQVLQQIGGFDERFFMYAEDIDLSFRIQQSGYKNYFMAETTIIHFKGESTKKGSLDYVRVFYKAMSLFVEKHYPSRRSFNMLIQMSIGLRGGLSAMERVLLPKKTQAPTGPVDLWVIGSAGETERAVKVIEDNKGSETHVQIKDYREDWRKQFATQRPDEVIFCEGVLSFKTIITLICELQGDTGYHIFSNGSGSIAGTRANRISAVVMA
ncbi:MAG: glycosyltransferase family 2 protein [Chitinophagaceae bacterium]